MGHKNGLISSFFLYVNKLIVEFKRIHLTHVAENISPKRAFS